MVDFHWNVYDPWTIVSVSDDVETTSGGGTLQVLLFVYVQHSNFCNFRFLLGYTSKRSTMQNTLIA